MLDIVVLYKQAFKAETPAKLLCTFYMCLKLSVNDGYFNYCIQILDKHSALNQSTDIHQAGYNYPLHVAAFYNVFKKVRGQKNKYNCMIIFSTIPRP